MNNLEQFALVLEPVTRGRIAAFGLTTAAFATAARLLRGVTSSGAVAGGVVCLLLMLAAGWGGFAALGTVFIMTWVATRNGYPRKQQLGSAERHAGRSAGQVLANLGVPALAALLYMVLHDPRLLVAMGAALSEVAADTLVLAFPVLIPFDDFAAIEHLVVERTNELLLHAMKIGAMQLVERDARAPRAGEETHRHGNQAKR